jgi:hypothetical protein
VKDEDALKGARSEPGPASDEDASLDPLDARLNEALEETFPASDPIAVSVEPGARRK